MVYQKEKHNIHFKTENLVDAENTKQENKKQGNNKLYTRSILKQK